MNHEAHVRMAQQLHQRLRGSGVTETATRSAVVSKSRYVSQDRFLLEKSRLFACTPQIVAHEAQLAEAGSCLAVEVAGVSLLLVRDSDGELRAFRNACRHRATQLVAPGPDACRKKAIVCPYHGWTYDLTGRRIHVPHLPLFAGAADDRDALAPGYVAARYGFIWASLVPFDVEDHIGGLKAELAALDAGSLVVHAQSQREVAGNWKLLVDAFLDGYHIRHLHRDTVYRFFFDAQSEVEQVGPHLRAATARRTLGQVAEQDLESSVIRDLVTPSYILFPNTVLILHPDYTSVLRLEALAANRTRFTHTMLVGRDASRDLGAHFDKSFALIDEGVFAAEDLVVVEAMQRGMESSADESLLFGDLEVAATWFHASVDAIVERP